MPPRSPSPPLRILGVDPGSVVAGWGLIEQRGQKLTLVDSGTIRPHRDLDFVARLRELNEGLGAIIDRGQPQVVAIESVFHGKHARSALQLGHARGVLILAAVQRDLPLYEYTPAAVKKAVTGSGSAAKEQVRRMVNLLLKAQVTGALDRSDAPGGGHLPRSQRGLPRPPQQAGAAAARRTAPPA